MLRLGHLLLLLVLCLAVFSIPTSFNKGKILNNIFKQIHNKKAVGYAAPYEQPYGFADPPYGPQGDEPNFFVIV
ncbi:unnamed protein product [Caenorhabditis auriculariae]|uniref:Uncharacterized protein n=1 Tax=Caenorhabditis auriculariae TaxID=2777116 RepID=A0A8S1H6U2_9PELO|nr:unnamed protein product [Caenorhabditis auriculariae]